VRIIAQGQFDVNQENTEGLVLALNYLDRFISGKCWRKPVYLVCLVYLVCSVCLVCSVEQDQLVELNKPNEPKKPDRPNEQDRPARGSLTAESLNRYKVPSIF
jgi:hypothetical protein